MALASLSVFWQHNQFEFQQTEERSKSLRNGVRLYVDEEDNICGHAGTSIFAYCYDRHSPH